MQQRSFAHFYVGISSARGRRPLAGFQLIIYCCAASDSRLLIVQSTDLFLYDGILDDEKWLGFLLVLNIMDVLA